MNNIEKLAIEHCNFKGFSEGKLEQVCFSINQLEAFAKALQSSEPVAEPISEFAKQPIGKILKNGEIDLYDTIDVINEMVGFEIFIHPQHVVYTHPPATVPLEKYNKLERELDIAKDVLEAHTLMGVYDKLIAEAEAEGKEG